MNPPSFSAVKVARKFLRCSIGPFPPVRECYHNRRFPRPCRLVEVRLIDLTSQFDVGQPLANDVRNGKTEAVTIGHIFPMAEPENLFVKVSEEVIPELCTGRTFRTPSALG
jgi:hypothetical protein